MHTLSSSFNIRKYRYVGFGSPFYADFVLFHKYLYMQDMLCIEHAPIKKRMRFNKPFPRIKLKFGEASDVIPNLDRNRPHIVWLDYDYPLTQDILDDLSGLSTVLTQESIILLTIEADPRIPTPDELPSKTIDDIARYRLEMVGDEIGDRIEGGVKRSHMTNARLPSLYATVVLDHLHDKLTSRALTFHSMFSFAYADGRQMLSLGGMIGTKETRLKIKDSGFFELPFISPHSDSLSTFQRPP